MRKTILLASALGVGLGLGGGCFFALDCAEDETCRPGTGGSSSSTATSSTSTSSTGTSSSTGTGGSMNCDPTMGEVADTCGVFVSSSKGSDTSGTGTKAQPYGSLTKALASAKGLPVYACGETFTEAVTLSAGVTLYGALVCSQTWMYDPAQKTTLTATAGAVPLTLASTAAGTVIHDFAIVAADAMMPGGSSIAVLDQAGVTLENVDLTAGKGAAGAVGTMQAAVVTPMTANGMDGGGDTACNVAGVFGGSGGANTCSGTDTSGGSGGVGQAATSGGDGSHGSPMMMASNAGSGQTTSAMCTAGQPGATGITGAAGTGARGLGNVSATGYAGRAGTLGGVGGPGQGGGGGGGAAQCAATFAGPSGGGGGAGGCGGAAGNSGQSGGSSIGILALGVTPTLKTVSITTNNGGAGGTGGDGQVGGTGGKPGMGGGAAACAGGAGGQGGTGGSGGGGAGGHSVAVAVQGAALPDLTSAMITLGAGGAGGPGGNMDMTMQTKGDGGMACKTLDFTPMATTPCAM